ncbi:MAG: CRISPR-associated endoribonuclease Cas6 [Desulfobacterales bacterium]|nr:CRISPR-associated endoribonuclease Cas6 [Desulfobacterales bacterium]
MRFTAEIILKGKPILPISYKKNFTRLIKESISPNTFQKYFSDRKKNLQKPFTFSVSFIVESTNPESEVFFLKNNKIVFHFSSNDSGFFSEVYNGLVYLGKGYCLFGDGEIYVKKFYLEKSLKINSEEIVFKTHSPILVRNTENKMGKGSISFEDKNFHEFLFYSIQNLCKNFIGNDYNLKPDQVEVTIVKCKKDIINHYGFEMGTSGIIKIKAPIEVLQLVYDIGLGAKRSQGFGMLEVLA